MSQYLQVTSGIEEEIAGFEVPVQHIGRVDVLESSQDLVEEVANMIIAQVLSFEQFVKIGLHQSLHNVAGLESGKIQYFLPSPSLYALLYDIRVQGYTSLISSKDVGFKMSKISIICKQRLKRVSWIISAKV